MTRIEALVSVLPLQPREREGERMTRIDRERDRERERERERDIERKKEERERENERTRERTREGDASCSSS